MDLGTIVVGYDGSTNAHRALEAAIALAGAETTVHVVTAYDEPSNHDIAKVMAIVPEEFRHGIDLLEGPRSHLRDAENLLGSKGVAHVGHFVEDRPAGAILDLAEEIDADLIVVGSRGVGRGTRFIGGSVSTRIATHAPRSFLVVHEDD